MRVGSQMVGTYRWQAPATGSEDNHRSPSRTWLVQMSSVKDFQSLLTLQFILNEGDVIYSLTIWAIA